MDEKDLKALEYFVEAIKAACSGGRAVDLVEVTWEDASNDPESVEVRPNLKITFSGVAVRETVTQ